MLLREFWNVLSYSSVSFLSSLYYSSVRSSLFSSNYLSWSSNLCRIPSYLLVCCCKLWISCWLLLIDYDSLKLYIELCMHYQSSEIRLLFSNLCSFYLNLIFFPLCCFLDLSKIYLSSKQLKSAETKLQGRFVSSLCWQDFWIWTYKQQLSPFELFFATKLHLLAVLLNDLQGWAVWEPSFLEQALPNPQPHLEKYRVLRTCLKESEL